jgi:hypothetical protein
MTPKQASLKKMLRLLHAAERDCVADPRTFPGASSATPHVAIVKHYAAKRREALAQADRVDVSALVTAGEVDADEDGT